MTRYLNNLFLIRRFHFVFDPYFLWVGGSATFTPALAPIPIPIHMTVAITIFLLFFLLLFLLLFRLLLLASSNDQNLLDICSYTPEAEGSDVQQFQDAEARVKANLSKVPAAPWKGLGEYRDYVLQVDAMQAPGICCALFERHYSTP